MLVRMEGFYKTLKSIDQRSRVIVQHESGSNSLNRRREVEGSDFINIAPGLMCMFYRTLYYQPFRIQLAKRAGCYRKALISWALYFANQWKNSISRKVFSRGAGTCGIALAHSTHAFIIKHFDIVHHMEP